MYLYKISQTENNDYDTYNSAVVCAESVEDAVTIHPYVSDYNPEIIVGKTKWDKYDGWVGETDLVKCEYLGVAVVGLKRGVVVASFNAG